MVFFEHLNIFPEATRLFIIKLADQGHPIAAEIIDLPLEPNQNPPQLNEREEEYLSAVVKILRANGTLFLEASKLTSPVPRADQCLGIPAPIPPTARPQPSQSVMSRAAAPPRVPASLQQKYTTLSDAPSAYPAPSVVLSSRPQLNPGPTALSSASAPLHIPASLQHAVSLLNAPTRGAAPSAYRPPSAGAGPSRYPHPAPGVTTASALTLPPPPPPPPQNQRVEEDEGNLEDETEDCAHTYSKYTAKKICELYANIRDHPDDLVETASLASVQLPDLNPEETKAEFVDLQDDVDSGRLSDAQMESIIYAWTKFEKYLDEEQRVRCGFFLGDGAGVGKGRTIAGLIKQHWYKSGKRILWVSVSQDLRRDARRDLDDLNLNNENNTGIEIYSPKGTNHIPDSKWKGVVFITYSLLRSGLPAVKKGKRRKKKSAAVGASRVAQLMATEAAEGTYSGGSTSDSDAGGDDEDEDQEDSFSFEIENLPKSSRLAQILKWLRAGGEEGEDALIIYDESHRAKNLLAANTQTARAVVHLQEQLPKARIMYSSATGASEPHNLAYMTRLWGTQKTKEMVELLSKAKLGALELAAISLKATGTYLARTLSYEGAEFHLEKVEISPEFDLMYERSAGFWTLLYQVMLRVGSNNKYWRGQFWGAHQRFYRSMLMASKVKKCAELCRDAIAGGMSVVIGLQSTGESVTEQMRTNAAGVGNGNNPDEYDDLVSAPRQILDTFIRNNFPVSNLDASTLTNAGLDSLVYQVWKAVKMWRNMCSVDELAAAVPTMTHAADAVDVGGNTASGVSGVGSTTAAEREAILTGENIDLTRIVTDQERAELEFEGESLAENLAAGEINVAALLGQEIDYSNPLHQNCVRAARAVYKAKKYKERVIEAISNANRTTAAAAAAPPAAQAAVPRGTTRGSLFIDLTGDTTDEEEDQQNYDPAGCERCSNPSDGAMATCSTCFKSKAHAACLGSYSVPVHFTCDTCLLKASGDVSVAAEIKREAGFAAGNEKYGVRIKPEPTSLAAAPGTDPVNTDPASKTLEELRVLLETAEHKLSEAESQLEIAKCSMVIDQETYGGIHNKVKQEAKFKAKQGHRSPVFHPACVTTTTPTETIANYRSATERPRDRLNTVPDEFSDAAAAENGALAKIRTWLLLIVNAGMDLPANPIDKLIEDCGGESKVAELTGRRGFIGLDDDKATARYKLRHDGDGPSRELNLREKDRFMNGQKRIAIISDAASTGISLQADKRVASRNFRRLHLTLELPWSADKAVQQFGRSHRANQQTAPVYKILVTPCGGEYRFASAAAKRLQSLGALLRGDRNAVGAGAELKAFDVDTPAGHAALQRMLRVIASEQIVMPGMTIPELPDNFKLKYGVPLTAANGNDGDDGEVNIGDAPNGHPSTKLFNIHFCRRLHSLGLLEEWSGNLSGYRVKSKSRKNEEYTGRHKNTGVKITQFLNRLLGLPIEEQDILFKFFSDTLDATISNLKSLGKYDNGIMSLQGQSISKKNEVVVLTDAAGASVKHVTVGLVQSVTFEEAQVKIEEAKQRIDEVTGNTRSAARHLSGFYVQRTKTWSLSGIRHPRITIALEVPDEIASAGRTDKILMREIPPHGQDFPKLRKMEDLRRASWRRIHNLDEAKTIWDAWYNYTATNCQHGEGCTTVNCKDGCRYTDKHLLCGAVLGYWDRLEKLHMHGPHAKRHPRNLYTETGERETHYSPNPLVVGRAITDVPGDPEASGEPIVGILAECEEEMNYLKQHMENRRGDPTYTDPLIAALGTNYADQNAVRGLDAGSDPFIRRFGRGASTLGAGRSGEQSKKPKNFR